MDEAEVGMLAIQMGIAQKVVEDWMKQQGSEGTLVTADRSPSWDKYEDAAKRFRLALYTAVEERVGLTAA